MRMGQFVLWTAPARPCTPFVYITIFFLLPRFGRPVCVRAWLICALLSRSRCSTKAVAGCMVWAVLYRAESSLRMAANKLNSDKGCLACRSSLLCTLTSYREHRSGERPRRFNYCFIQGCGCLKQSNSCPMHPVSLESTQAPLTPPRTPN
ncbi:hypothetical protein LY78DRAFT_89278 [Colletotrichum sublineola]|nr:hypothetical protein LY78DRAFT_89278 [Colletotrichum sublineola]